MSLEVLFLPLCLMRQTRLVAWSLMIGMHLSILIVVDCMDLTFGMVMFHLLTFDPEWFPARVPQSGRSVVYYDGVCGLCNRSMRFLIDEDRDHLLYFAPLQGPTFAAVNEAIDLQQGLDSMVYIRAGGSNAQEVFVKSDALVQIMSDLGGLWRVVSWVRWIPRPIRNRVYDWIAKNRYRWFGQYDDCRLPTPTERTQLLP